MSSRKPSSVTIRAVATRAGVSAMTVSNVINGTGRVSPATAEIVRAAIDDLGYIPNIAARRLARARSTTIALMYTNERTPFLEEILVGALRATNARGMQLILHEGVVSEAGEAAEAAASLAASGVNALLLMPPFAELLSAAGILPEIGMPATGIATGGPLPGMATVRIDNRAAMTEMTRLVLARGHRRIGFVAGPSSNGDSAERRAGFQDALREAGVPGSDDILVAGRYDYDSGLEAGALLLDRAERPTAIICSNDAMAAGVVAEASRRGLRLPRELAVTGFDDTLIAVRMWPPLTVIRQPVERMAFSAVEVLVDLMNTGATDDAPDHVLPHQLVDRASVPDIRRAGRRFGEASRAVTRSGDAARVAPQP